jgi:lysophospholipase L1-like esterase
MTNRYKTMSRRRQTAALLAGLVASIIVMALLAEAAVRIREMIRDGPASEESLAGINHTDPATGLRLMTAGTHSSRLSINSLGLRGPEIPRAKPVGAIRVAFLGASAMFCAEVSSDAMVWPSLVIDRLRAASPGQAFDFVNASIPGYTFAAMQRLLENVVAPLKPDLVVIYEGHNDMTEVMAAAARRQGIVFDPGDTGLSWLSRYSLFDYLVEKNILILRRQRMATSDSEKLRVPSATFETLYEERLTALVRAAKAVADQVVLVTFSARLRSGQSPEERIQAGVTDLYYMPYRTPDDIIRDYAAVNEAMRRVARREGAGLIEAATAIPGDKQHFVDSVHFSDAGSQMMADIVASGLAALNGTDGIRGRQGGAVQNQK